MAEEIHPYPYMAFQFDVQIRVTLTGGSLDGQPALCSAAFAECDGLEMTMEPKVVREGGNNSQHIHLAGPITYGNLTLKRGMTGCLDLWNWFGALMQNDGIGALADVTVRLLQPGSATQALRTFTLTGCLPIKIKAPALNARDGQAAIEELQIAYQTLEVK